MTKGNLIDLIMYRKPPSSIATGTISEELQTAIQTLIYQLRELGPIENIQADYT